MAVKHFFQEDLIMNIDRSALEKLLTLNDRQLMAIINKLVADSGIDPVDFNINTQDISSLRKALSGATDEDLKRIAEQYEANKRNRGGR